MDESLQNTDKKELVSTLGTDKSKILLADTSWIVAVLDSKDSHHISAKSSLGALLPYGPTFHVPILVSIETISRLIRVNKISVSACKVQLLDFLVDQLHAKGATSTYEIGEILNRYKIWSRKEVKNLTAIDFCVVTEGMALGAKILTCDLKMYKTVKKYYDQIYFMSDQVSSQVSDLSRLIHDIQLKK